MRHDWIFAVLADLAAYADRNGLQRLSAKAAEALAVARDEIADARGEVLGKVPGQSTGGGAGSNGGEEPPVGRMN